MLRVAARTGRRRQLADGIAVGPTPAAAAGCGGRIPEERDRELAGRLSAAPEAEDRLRAHRPYADGTLLQALGFEAGHDADGAERILLKG